MEIDAIEYVWMWPTIKIKMKKKLIILIILLFPLINNFGQILSEWDSIRIVKEDSLKSLWTKKSLFFPQKQFDKVIGYSYNKGIIEESEDLETSIYDTKTKRFSKTIYFQTNPLNNFQVSELLNIINDTTTFTWGESGCFVPHNAFVFFYKNKIVAYVNIGKNCSQITARPWTPIMRDGGLSIDGINRFRKYYKEIGLPND